jgi:CSLREA domain-containing protein
MKALMLLLAAVVASLSVVPPVRAATFVVNSKADATDANTMDGVCAAAGGSCTLRAAIVQANALMGADTITLPAETYSTGSELTISSNLTINGAGARVTRITGPGGGIVVRATGTAEVALSGMTIGGGAMGMYVVGSELTLDRVTISGNTAASPANLLGVGMRIDPGSKVLIKRSAITGNSGTQMGGFGLGGGIYASGTQLEVRSSTIAGNTMTSSSTSYGGGIYVNQGTVSLRHVTLSGNTATSSTAAQGGGNLFIAGGSATTADSIFVGGVSGAGSQNCGPNKPVASGRNIDSGVTCGFGAGQLSSTAPQLGGLGSAGGQTDGMLPALSSPAIGQAGACPEDGVDQRGAPAPTGAACDIGAVEVSSNIGVALAQSRADVAPGSDVAFIATVSNTGLDPANAATLDVTPSGAADVVTVVPSTGTCTKAVRCELGAIAAGAQVTVTIVLRAGSAGTLTAAASVASSTPGVSSADDAASASAAITGAPAGPPPVGPGGGTENAAPVLGTLKRVGKARTGKAIRLTSTLSEEATLSIRVDRLTSGRRSGKRCSTTARRGKRCTVVRSVGALAATGRAGTVSLTVPAKVARRKLAPGRYRVSVQATDAGGLRSATRTLTITVTR